MGVETRTDCQIAVGRGRGQEVALSTIETWAQNHCDIKGEIYGTEI